MKVLLTRPTGHNQAMVDALTAKGIPHMVTPLLTIEPDTNAESLATEVLTADIIIFISANAVKFGSQALGQAWPEHIQYFAVGQATSAALSQLGVMAQSSADDNQQTEGLLVLDELNNISAEKNISGKKVVIVRGNGGRELLGQTLVKRGADVSYWQVYSRGCPSFDASVICRQWQDFGVDTIIITSPAVLDNLITLVPKELFPWLCSCHIIVPSSRVEAKAISLGMKYVTNAAAADCKAMLAAL